MKFAIRQLAKNPGFSVVALLTLALGIGVNTTAFTVLNRLLLQSLPYQDPAHLVQVWASVPRETYAGHAPGDFFDEQEQNTVFSDMAAYIPGAYTSLAEPGQPAVREGVVGTTANFFKVLGVQPQLGRLPSVDEEARFEPVTLLSNIFWREHFAADPGVIGLFFCTESNAAQQGAARRRLVHRCCATETRRDAPASPVRDDSHGGAVCKGPPDNQLRPYISSDSLSYERHGRNRH